MKKTYLCIATLFILFAVVFCSCNSDEKIAHKLYKQREYLLKEFNDKSIISRSEIFYQLSYYKGQAVNTFYFEKKDDVLVFTNDTIQYPINEIPAFASVNIADSSNCRNALTSELSRLLKVMNDFKISHVSAENRYAGVDMKIYFGDYKALLYVTDVAGIKNERWKNYVTSGKKLDDNWYFVEEK
jgi:hypothetical protein